MFAVCQTRFYTLSNSHLSLRTQHFHLPTLPAHPCCCHQSVPHQKRLISCASDIAVLYPTPTPPLSYFPCFHRRCHLPLFPGLNSQAAHRVTVGHILRLSTVSGITVGHTLRLSTVSSITVGHILRLSTVSGITVGHTLRLSTVSGTVVGHTLRLSTVSGITVGLTLSPPSLSSTKLTGSPSCPVLLLVLRSQQHLYSFN